MASQRAYLRFARAGPIRSGSSQGQSARRASKSDATSKAQRVEEQLEHGGLLLWVRTWHADKERHALASSSSTVYVRGSRYLVSASPLEERARCRTSLIVTLGVRS